MSEYYLPLGGDVSEADRGVFLSKQRSFRGDAAKRQRGFSLETEIL